MPGLFLYLEVAGSKDSLVIFFPFFESTTLISFLRHVKTLYLEAYLQALLPECRCVHQQQTFDVLS
jgi:hypothetical protein